MSEDHSMFYDEVIAPVERRMMSAVWAVTRNADDAEEALQDALCTIWRRVDKVRRHPNPDALVLRICLNAAYDLVRARIRRRRRARALEQDRPAPAPTPEDRYAARETGEAIRDAIGALPRQQAVAVSLRFVEGAPYDEVARVLGCRDATARKHVERGRKRLRQLLTALEME